MRHGSLTPPAAPGEGHDRDSHGDRLHGWVAARSDGARLGQGGKDARLALVVDEAGVVDLAQ